MIPDEQLRVRGQTAPSAGMNARRSYIYPNFQSFDYFGGVVGRRSLALPAGTIELKKSRF